MESFFARTFRNLKNWLFPTAAAKKDFGVDTAVGTTMQQNINLWYSMYINEPPWAKRDIIPLGLPAAIAREMARPALVEFNGTVTGGARADFLDTCFQDAARSFEKNLEMGLALGGLALRPYVYNGTLKVDASSIMAFQPTNFDEAGKCTGGVFRERVQLAGKWYVRLESHEFVRDGDRTAYVVRNKAHKSNQYGTVGEEVPLDTVPAWATLDDETTLDGVERPLFAFFTPPVANNIDTDSRLGVSVYGGSIVGLVKDADEQWDRLWWEFKSGERKIFAEYTSGNARDFGRNRLYEFGPFMSQDGDFFKEFSPAFRDDAIYRGFQNILKQIEFQTGLAYGTISDPSSVEKTSTEILASKQRQYITESHIQQAFGDALDDLVYAMDVYATLYALAPQGDYELHLSFGDGVLDDPESNRAEMAADLQLVSAGILNAYEFRQKHFGEDEETAKAMLPGMEEMVDEPQGELE